MKNILFVILMLLSNLIVGQSKYNLTQVKYNDYSDYNKEKIFQWNANQPGGESFTEPNDGVSIGKRLIDCYELKSISMSKPSAMYINKNIDSKSDFEIEASIKFVHGLGDNMNGIGWGIDNNKSGYYFGFTSNGYFCILKQNVANIKYYKEWTYSSVINVDGYNLLSIRKVKNIYYYFINKVLVYSSQFDSFYGDIISLHSNRNSEININNVSISYLNKGQINSDGFSLNLPPILSIQDIVFSKGVLKANETAQLIITMKNIGDGDANNVSVNLSSDITGLSYPSKSIFPNIRKGGGTQTIIIDVKGLIDLPTSEATLKLELVESNFKVKIQGKQIKFKTQEFFKPELLLAKFAVLENLSANPNNQIDINEQIDVKFAIQNIGQGDAEKVTVSVINNQPGVLLLGVDSSGQTIRKNPTFKFINTGKYETVTYRYFVNSEFTGNQLIFNISTNEKYGKHGFSQIKSVEINKILSEEGYIRNVAHSDNNQLNNGKVIIEDVPDFIADVDFNIPANTLVNDKTFAIVIGNEVYTNEIKVKYAINDARIFKQYLQKTFGLPANNIEYLENATYGQILDKLKWLNEISKAYNGKAKLIFYYAGHGLPDEKTKSSFILPADGNSKNTISAISLGDIYKSLTEYNSSSVTVFLDACFSGASREASELMLAQGRGVKIKPREEELNGNLVVFSAASGDQTAFPYEEKRHGMFTYFLLKKIQETKGDITLNNLSNYVITNVSQVSIVINKKSQIPQVNTSYLVQDSWGSYKLK